MHAYSGRRSPVGNRRTTANFPTSWCLAFDEAVDLLGDGIDLRRVGSRRLLINVVERVLPRVSREYLIHVVTEDERVVDVASNHHRVAARFRISGWTSSATPGRASWWSRAPRAGSASRRCSFNTDLVSVAGEDHLEAITIENCGTGATKTVPADAIFVFIGAVPHTDMIAGVVERDDEGFVLTGQDLIRDGRRPKNWRLRRDPFLMETSVPGNFAAGDVRHGVIRRVASAVGQGAVAVSLVHKYLETV